MRETGERGGAVRVFVPGSGFLVIRALGGGGRALTQWGRTFLGASLPTLPLRSRGEMRCPPSSSPPRTRRRWPNPFRPHRHGVDPNILHRRDSLVPCSCRTVGDGARTGSSARSSGCVGLACDLNWRSGGVSPFFCLETRSATLRWHARGNSSLMRVRR